MQTSDHQRDEDLRAKRHEARTGPRGDRPN